MADEPVPAPSSPEQPLEFKPLETKPSRKKMWLILVSLLVLGLIVAGLAVWQLTKSSPKTVANSAAKTQTATKVTSSSQAATYPGLQLDTSKNYGNKYANGLLPVGDGKYTTTTPQVGEVYACSQYAHSLSSNQGGAGKRGPWFTNNNTEYNVNQKLHVEGSVMWQASFSNTVSGSTRTIVTNDLPNQPSGIFPIMSSDPAYSYDRNPNSIKAQSLTYALPLNPTYSATPNCMGGDVGVMLNGVVLFNGFDAGGRDAGAWEIQDSCDAHPQQDGIYHYHTLSSCIKNATVTNVIGYALDGFPITGPEISPGNYLTTANLDECHGITSQITLNGKPVTMYHYVMTEDFPYSVSCFRGTPISSPTMAAGQQSGQGQPGQPHAAGPRPS